MSEKDTILEVKNLHVHYVTDDEEVKAVNGISFSIGKQETLGLVGETGAGKTTTALSILRLLPDRIGKITSGSITYRGEDLLAKTPAQMRKIRGESIAMIFQDPMTSLNPVLTVGDQILEALELHNDEGKSKEELDRRVEEMLELVSIPAVRKKDYPHQFSGGMKQRVVIAMALACNPGLLIADEPTTALDVTIEAQILHLMRKLQQEHGTSILMITHNLGVVAEICDYVYVMYAGKVVEYSEVHELFQHTSHPYTQGLIRSLPKMEAGQGKLYNIKGMVPDLLHLPQGCRFAPRCEHACERCHCEMPPLYDIGGGHLVRCFLYEEQGTPVETAEGGEQE